MEGYYVKMDFINASEDGRAMQFKSLEALLSELGIDIVHRYESIGRIFVTIPDETAVLLQEKGYLVEKEIPGTFRALPAVSSPHPL